MGPYTVFNAEGQPHAGDAVISQNMKDMCDRIGGHIEDSTGATVWPEGAAS